MLNHCAELWAFAWIRLLQWNKLRRVRALEEAKYPVTRTKASGNKIRGHHIVTCILKLINKIETNKKPFAIETNGVDFFSVLINVNVAITFRIHVLEWKAKCFVLKWSIGIISRLERISCQAKSIKFDNRIKDHKIHLHCCHWTTGSARKLLYN